jgi:polyisoprenoid-binding protein YceI
MAMAPERWEIDSAHSGIHFSIHHMLLVPVRGQFARWTGTLVAPGGHVRGAEVRLMIDPTSITTGIEERDLHLKSGDFLDTAACHEWTFTGEVANPSCNGRFSIQGTLAAMNRTLPLTFKARATGRSRDPWGNLRAGFRARGSLSLAALGLTWNQPLVTGGLLLGDRVDLEIDVEAVRQPPPRPR